MGISEVSSARVPISKEKKVWSKSVGRRTSVLRCAGSVLGLISPVSEVAEETHLSLLFRVVATSAVVWCDMVGEVFFCSFQLDLVSICLFTR